MLFGPGRGLYTFPHACHHLNRKFLAPGAADHFTEPHVTEDILIIVGLVTFTQLKVSDSLGAFTEAEDKKRMPDWLSACGRSAGHLIKIDMMTGPQIYWI